LIGMGVLATTFTLNRDSKYAKASFASIRAKRFPETSNCYYTKYVFPSNRTLEGATPLYSNTNAQHWIKSSASSIYLAVSSWWATWGKFVLTSHIMFVTSGNLLLNVHHIGCPQPCTLLVC
jgi:hypothetical protein